VARSFHTDPLRIRAERRTRDPWTKRGAQDERRARAARRAMLGHGLVPVDAVAPRTGVDEPRDAEPAPQPALHAAIEPPRPAQPPPEPPAPPRVEVQAPRPGHLHPATPGAVRARLAALGTRFFYGLTLVELAQGAPGRLVFGRFSPVGQVRLFDVPAPPWRLPGISVDDALRLQRAGATVSLLEPHVVVDWPGTTLRDFYLDEVLLHELGHHALQHFRGKRAPPRARTKDHEAFAQRFAASAREALAHAERRSARTAAPPVDAPAPFEAGEGGATRPADRAASGQR
jgi:hypothetical protein